MIDPEAFVREIPQTRVIFWQRWGQQWPATVYFLTEDPFRFAEPCWQGVTTE